MKKISLLCTLVILLFSCSSNNEEIDLLVEEETEVISNDEETEENTVPTASLLDDSWDCSESEVFNPNFNGTACCIERITELSFDEPIRYWYSTNLENPSFVWEVISGEIEIIQGQENAIVTIRLKEGFDGGEIRGKGTSSPTSLNCSTSVIIEKRDN